MVVSMWLALRRASSYNFLSSERSWSAADADFVRESISPPSSFRIANLYFMPDGADIRSIINWLEAIESVNCMDRLVVSQLSSPASVFSISRFISASFLLCMVITCF